MHKHLQHFLMVTSNPSHFRLMHCCLCSSSDSCRRAAPSSPLTSSSLVSTTSTRCVKTLITSLRFCCSSAQKQQEIDCLTLKKPPQISTPKRCCTLQEWRILWSCRRPHHSNVHTSAPAPASCGGLAPRRAAACAGRLTWCSALSPGLLAQPSATGAPSSAAGLSSRSGHSQDTLMKHKEVTTARRKTQIQHDY